jgi:hypothetical protein
LVTILVSSTIPLCLLGGPVVESEALVVAITGYRCKKLGARNPVFDALGARNFKETLKSNCFQISDIVSSL